MVTYTDGDILKAPTEALVNPVNCMGVMGVGLAKLFKEAFPDNYSSYHRACENGLVQPGKIWAVHRTIRPNWIFNFPTKDTWWLSSRMEWIETGLEDLTYQLRTNAISSIAIPALGCGLGGLDWSEVQPKIEAAFAPLPKVKCIIYRPRD